MQLVIAEKPSVARNIAKVFQATNVKDGYLEGKEYLVSWCIGHLIELASADQYRDDWKAWKYETLPMIPENWKYQIKESTKGQFRVLKELLHRADITEVICATDAGREGELIFRLVYNQAECKLPFKRLWISSMEEKAILEGFQQLKDGHEYDDLYYSAVARSEADWLVGINATRLFTVLYHHRLIVGRVQTPTLAMLVEREKSIENFQKEKYYLVHLLMDGLDAVSSRIKEKSAAVQMMEDMKDETAQILSVKKEKKKVQPPKLYDLTTLQRDANRLLGFTAQQTLDYTQSLYEKKLVTYPRTDSQYLTDDMEENALLVVGAVNSMFPEMSIKGSEPDIKRLLNSKKVSDHHAIIPTVEITNMDLKALPGGEKEILMLIASKLLCASEQEYIYESKDTGDVQGAKMEDEQAMGKVILNKTDKDTKKPMKGVEFALCDSKGKVLETLVTDSAGHAESKNYPIATFKNGQYKKAITYILKETKTLDGYQLDETEHKIQFEYVNDRTPVIEYTLDLTNKKAPEKDTPETSENQGVSTPGSHGSDATSVSNSPKTGDNTNIAIFVLALAVSAGCLGTVVTVKRKRK